MTYNLIKNFAIKMENASVRKKKSKLRLMFLLMLGAEETDKLQPFGIGKTIKLKSFLKHKDLTNNIFIKQNILKDFFFFTGYLAKLDKSMKIQNRKKILFIDQCSAHPQIYNF